MPTTRSFLLRPATTLRHPATSSSNRMPVNSSLHAPTNLRYSFRTRLQPHVCPILQASVSTSHRTDRSTSPLYRRLIAKHSPALCPSCRRTNSGRLPPRSDAASSAEAPSTATWELSTTRPNSILVLGLIVPVKSSASNTLPMTMGRIRHLVKVLAGAETVSR